MEYKKYGDTYYIRMDRGDEIIENILGVCRKERIISCTYSGIGGCGQAEIQTYIPETNTFESNVIKGMLELVSLTGNVTSDEADQLYHHTHGIFTYKEGNEHKIAGGHLKSIVVSYTAEITLKPVADGEIRRQYDEETGTGFWKFKS